MRYTLSGIAKIVGGVLHGSDNVVCGVSTDSRNHTPSDTLFVAINGIHHNGHLFIDDLSDRGVRAFLCEYTPAKTMEGVGYVVAKDSLKALQLLAAHHREEFKGTVVAITGSNGKTIVKEWIAQLWLPQNGTLTRSPRSYNSQIGVPLSLLMIRGDERVAVIEAGISKPGEMEKLEQMIRPDVVLFTNIGPAHGENFASQEEKLKEKETLFKRARKVIKASNTGSIEERNLSCVLGMYDYLGLSHGDLSLLQPVAMRLEVQEGILGSVIINDSYNSDIASLAIALDFAAGQSANRKALVLSDIVGGTENTYREAARLAMAHDVKLFVGVGEQLRRYRDFFGAIAESYFYSTTEECLANIAKGCVRDSVVLIKGSRPFGFERLSSSLESRTHTTVLEVDLTAMVDNLNRYRALIKSPTKVMAMVKASGYGSGTGEVAAALQHQRVDYLAVAFADEGVELRKAAIHIPIVVLNSDNGSFATMIEQSLEPEIYSISSLREYIAEANKQGVTNLPIHLKLDTGMHRLGFMNADIDELLNTLSSQNVVYIGSIFSHLAASEDPSEDAFTRGQIALFDRMSSRIVSAMQPHQQSKILRHICNTAAIGRFPEAHFDMVRVGIGLYSGAEPGAHTVSRLFTKIVQIKELQSGETVGYNRRGKVDTTKRIAILPIGYADGLARVFGQGNASFNVDGTLCPTIGNICMDTTIIDITAAPNATEGSTVEIFGDNPTASQMAAIRGTIEYEILTSVSNRIKRVYITE